MSFPTYFTHLSTLATFSDKHKHGNTQTDTQLCSAWNVVYRAEGRCPIPIWSNVCFGLLFSHSYHSCLLSLTHTHRHKDRHTFVRRMKCWRCLTVFQTSCIFGQFPSSPIMCHRDSTLYLAHVHTCVSMHSTAQRCEVLANILSACYLDTCSTRRGPRVSGVWCTCVGVLPPIPTPLSISPSQPCPPASHPIHTPCSQAGPYFMCQLSSIFK